MASVKYIAPIGLDLHQYSETTCRVFPRAIISPRLDRRPFLVEVETDWKDAGISEGDLLVVDEQEIPIAGSMCIFADDDKLHACRVHERRDGLWPIFNSQRDEGMRLVFCGTVTRMVRFFHD